MLSRRLPNLANSVAPDCDGRPVFVESYKSAIMIVASGSFASARARIGKRTPRSFSFRVINLTQPPLLIPSAQ